MACHENGVYSKGRLCTARCFYLILKLKQRATHEEGFFGQAETFCLLFLKMQVKILFELIIRPFFPTFGIYAAGERRYRLRI